MTVTDEDVEDMMMVLKMAGVYERFPKFDLQRIVREKLEEGKTPCFESMRWVKREKTNEMGD